VRHWLHEAAKEAGIVYAQREEIIELLQRWIDEDRKATPLKALQGMIWDEGYRSGDFRAHVYPDVAPKLREWKKQGSDLYIYSSGSVPAQKLFFEFSEAGDLTPLLSGYFDTGSGTSAKRNPTAASPPRSAGRRRKSCSCPTSSKNSTPRAQPACARRNWRVRPQRVRRMARILARMDSMPSR
jgi:hypothetical protein